MMRWRNWMATLVSVGLLSGCQQPGEDQGGPTKDDAATASPTAVLPVTEIVLDREALLRAVMHAASNAALGRSQTGRQRELDGKRFEMRLRFGCEGARDSNDQGPRGYAFDEKRRILSLEVQPEIDGALPLIRSLTPSAYEAVEGFWIRRPWLLAAACPAAAPAVTPVEAPPADTTAPTPEADPELAPSSPRVGIAQFFTSTDTRTHRRDKRAYSARKVLADGEMPSPVGYDLVIAGRLRALADGRVIACKSNSAAAPPSCIISAQFDRVTIEQPASGETIAKWSSA